MPRINPVSRPEHQHTCQFCKSAWVCDGHANLCTLFQRCKPACWDCMRPEKVRARAIKEMEKRDAERNSGRENFFTFQRQRDHGGWNLDDLVDDSAGQDDLGEDGWDTNTISPTVKASAQAMTENMAKWAKAQLDAAEGGMWEPATPFTTQGHA